MLTVHHLGVSQSERIVWLCEELGIDYKLVTYSRDPLLAPESLKSLPGNDVGTAPFVQDEGGITLSESSGIIDYIIHKYGGGKLALKPEDPHYADYCEWFHYANGTLQPAFIDSMFLQLAGVEDDNQMRGMAGQRLEKRLQAVDKQLASNKYLAGDSLTAADIMTVYTLTTQRYWGPQLDLTPYKNIVRYLQDVSERPAYKRAMEKGDPEMAPLVGAKSPSTGMFEVGGVKSDHWKKK